MTTMLAAVAENPNMLETFGFNVPFLAAQLVNFILVIWVLKKFAFGPVQVMLEQRRARIAEGEANLKRISQQLAQSEQIAADTIAKANEEAVRLINEAMQGASALSEQSAQEALAQAQHIITKAESAAKAERDRLNLELKREFGRLIASTTAQVTGKVLTLDDQKRINEDALAGVES